MRFLYAKKKSFRCKGCGLDINRGNMFVRASYQNRETNVWYGFNYHPDCYLSEFKRRFNQSLLHWKEKLIPPKKLGRHLVPTSDRPKRRRLLSLLAYHRKAGNEDKVISLKKEIWLIPQLEDWDDTKKE